MPRLEIVSDLERHALLSRLEVTEGICSSALLADVNLVFQQGTHAPTQKWRRANAADFYAPAPGQAVYKYWMTLGLFRAPHAFVERLLQIDAEVQNGPSGHDLDFAPDLAARVDAIAEAFDLWPEIYRFGPVLGMAINRQQGGEYLSTPEPADEMVKTGLHVDSWDHKPWSDRAGGTNRISINIGKFPRNLVFCTVPVVDISRTLNKDPGARVFPTGLIQQFFTMRPETRVYRMRLEPGDAYIAPTENIIHDGSTLLVDGEDAQVVVRGFLAHQAMIGEGTGVAETRLQPAVVDAI